MLTIYAPTQLARLQNRRHHSVPGRSAPCCGGDGDRDQCVGYYFGVERVSLGSEVSYFLFLVFVSFFLLLLLFRFSFRSVPLGCRRKTGVVGGGGILSRQASLGGMSIGYGYGDDVVIDSD